MNTVLLNILTHGDETVGLKVAGLLRSKYAHPNITVHTANSRAFELGKRFVELDLNRAFPGNENGAYEERLACSISKKIAMYDIVVDIHSTESGAGDMVIIAKATKEIKELINYVKPKYVLYMDMGSNTSLISQAKIGVALEMGKNSDPQTIEKSVLATESILSFARIITEPHSLGFRTQYFRVYSEVLKPDGYKLKNDVANFNLIKKNVAYASDGQDELLAKNDFYPVIFGNSNYEKIFGFAAEKIESLDNYLK